jgi:hypothetical protein
MTYRNLHRMAELTISEGAATPVRLARFTERPDLLSRESEKCVSSPPDGDVLQPSSGDEMAGARHAQLRRLRPCVSTGAPLVAVLPPRLRLRAHRSQSPPANAPEEALANYESPIR